MNLGAKNLIALFVRKKASHLQREENKRRFFWFRKVYPIVHSGYLILFSCKSCIARLYGTP